MSWEAWGTPPDSEPELCPICDNTQHTPDKCEVAAAEDHARKHYEGAIALLLQDRERRLTEAYAEGRKDEAEEGEKMRRALGDIISQTIVTERMGYSDPQDWQEKSARIRQIARDALAPAQPKTPPCAHAWTPVHQGVLYADLKCGACGETKRETWD